jgi:tRNA threonylcarbamoyladenosine biosynthesis protein TsaB
VYILGIDTATPVTSVAIGSESGTVAAFEVRRERGHAAVLAPAVRFLLDSAGLDGGAIGGVAVGIGPGLFSGLRVGVSSAKALAQAWGCPMIGVSSLDLLAFASRQTQRTVCAAIDAKRGEVFAAFYRGVPGGVLRVGDVQVVRPDALAAAIEARKEDVLLVGDGARAYREEFSRVHDCYLGPVALAAPSATALVELAVPLFEREEFVQPFDVHPLYLRRPDADPSARVALRVQDSADGPAQDQGGTTSAGVM